jgi:hypothetical protein
LKPAAVPGSSRPDTPQGFKCRSRCSKPMAGELRALPVASELGVRRETSRTGTISTN